VSVERATGEPVEEKVTEEGVPCPACGERHHYGVFTREEGCPDCGRTLAELRAIARGGSA
jgi:ssDNA-binding Zn-finger/Zn-ribbon topoisomerase 1